MRSAAMIAGLSSAAIVLCTLCGCSWKDVFQTDTPTLSNAIAVDRALQLCSLTQGEQPFHLILDIASADRAHPHSRLASDMQAQVEVYWLNPISYRTVIRSPKFKQIRIVNGRAVEEHNTGDFYPRWIQNFVDAILDPVPKAATLRKVPGTVPIGVQAHACISNADRLNAIAGDLPSAQICFQDADPKIASGADFTRSVWFSDFAPFGNQEIPRTLINDLPANSLVRGQIQILEPLRQADYPLLKAREFTPSEKQLQTTLVPTDTARSLLEASPVQTWPAAPSRSDSPPSSPEAGMIYIRTDRTGRVREAYRDRSDIYGLQSAAVDRAMTLKFRPLVIHGTPQQMEAPLTVPF
jgi:hypothetical protein